MRKLIVLKFIAICALFALPSGEASAQTQKGLLWEISGRGIDRPVYLFGTIHIYDTTNYRLPQPPFNLIKKVQKVYFELDFSKLKAADMMSRLFITDSTQFTNKLLKPEALTKLNEIVGNSPLLKPWGKKIYQIKPIFLSALLANDGRIASLDMELFKAAKVAKDSIGGLETVDEQMQAIEAITLPLQIKLLQDILSNYTSPANLAEMMTQVYASQDVDNLLQKMNNDMPLDPNFNKTLVDERNIRMVERMIPEMGRQSTLIAVGAGHLGGKNGIIALLRKKGYKVKNLPFNFSKTKAA